MITAAELCKKVRQLVNEAENDAAVTLLSVDTRSLDEHIAALMPDAVLLVQRNKGWGCVNPKSYDVPTENIGVNDDGTGFFCLPDDFVSLVALHLDGWERPCTFLYPAASAVAMAQHNVNTRAGSSKPVCVEGVSATGERLLCYYSLPQGKAPVVETFVYEASYDPSQGLLGSDVSLHKAVAYQCAALLFGLFERGDAAAYYSHLAAAFCNNVEPEKSK